MVLAKLIQNESHEVEAPFTSPLWGEVGLRSNPGEGAGRIDGFATAHPDILAPLQYPTSPSGRGDGAPT